MEGRENVTRCAGCISWPALLRTYSVENRNVDGASVVYGRERGAAAPFNPKKQSALARRLLWAILTSIINPDDTWCRSARVVNYREYFRIVL